MRRAQTAAAIYKHSTYFAWSTQMNSAKYINPATLLTPHALVRVCWRMPACVWEQHVVKQAGWMVMQTTASSRCEMHGACVTADR